MYFNRDYRAVLKRGEWIDKQKIEDANYAGFIVFVCLLCTISLVVVVILVHGGK